MKLFHNSCWYFEFWSFWCEWVILNFQCQGDWPWETMRYTQLDYEIFTTMVVTSPLKNLKNSLLPWLNNFYLRIFSQLGHPNKQPPPTSRWDQWLIPYWKRILKCCASVLWKEKSFSNYGKVAFFGWKDKIFFLTSLTEGYEIHTFNGGFFRWKWGVRVLSWILPCGNPKLCGASQFLKALWAKIFGWKMISLTSDGPNLCGHLFQAKLWNKVSGGKRFFQTW